MALTNDEAIKILSVNGWGFTDGELKEATQMAVKALRKETPQKIIERSKEVIPGEFIHWDECPCCHTEMEYEWGGEPYCPHCGHAVDWSEVEEWIAKKH